MLVGDGSLATVSHELHELDELDELAEWTFGVLRAPGGCFLTPGAGWFFCCAVWAAMVRECSIFTQYRKTRDCHPFVTLRASSERVGPVKLVAAKIQRRVSARPGDSSLVSRRNKSSGVDPLRMTSNR